MNYAIDPELLPLLDLLPTLDFDNLAESRRIQQQLNAGANATLNTSGVSVQHEWINHDVAAPMTQPRRSRHL